MPVGDFLGAQWKQIAAQGGRGRYSGVLSQKGVCKANGIFQISYQLIKEKKSDVPSPKQSPGFFHLFEAKSSLSFRNWFGISIHLGLRIDFQLRQICTTCFCGKRIQAHFLYNNIRSYQRVKRNCDLIFELTCLLFYKKQVMSLSQGPNLSFWATNHQPTNHVLSG